MSTQKCTLIWCQDELSKSKKLSRISLPELSQPCCTAVQIAIVDMLAEWGIKPSAVIGHSSGEIAAAYASGAMSAATAIQSAYFRGLVVAMNAPTGGSMVAVGLDRLRVEVFLRPGVVIGCENSPSSVTLSGDTDVLEAVTAKITARYPDAFVRALKVQCAYHSHDMKLVAHDYAAMLQHLPYGSPNIPFYSSVTGELLEGTIGASYWVQNLVSPVLFLSAANKMLGNPATSLLLEVGPHSALAGPIRQTVKASAVTADYIPTLVRGTDAVSSMLECAGSLFQRGCPVDFDVINSSGKVLVDLPTYPWQRDGHYWSESRLSQSWRQRVFLKHDILGSRVVEVSLHTVTTQLPSHTDCRQVAGSHPTWRNLLRLEDVPWIRDHKIGDDTVFPGAGYISMACEVRHFTSFA
jgi:acyl transferase domain-containing protein